MSNPFRYFKTSPEIIRLAVMLYVRFPLSLRNVEDLLHERGIEVSHETIRVWWNRFGPMFAAEIRRKRAQRMRAWSQWQWHLDEMFVKIGGETHYLWRAVDHEGEVLEAYVSKKRDRQAALIFLRKAMKRYGRPQVIVTDELRSYGAAMKSSGYLTGSKPGAGSTTGPRIHICPCDDENERCCVSDACEVCRNSLPSTPPSITTSTRNATSTAETTLSETVPPLFPSGVGWAWPETSSSSAN
jgi:putative transposase